MAPVPDRVTSKGGWCKRHKVSVELFLAIVVAAATVIMAWFAWEAYGLQSEAVKQTDNAMRADNRPDLLIEYMRHEDPQSNGGIRLTNTGKGPAALISIYMRGLPSPYRHGLSETYVPVQSAHDSDDKRLSGIIQEMISSRTDEQHGWQFDDKRAWSFCLFYRDIFDNIYMQDFLYQPQPKNPVPIWQKGCRFLGKAQTGDPYAENLVRARLRTEDLIIAKPKALNTWE